MTELESLIENVKVRAFNEKEYITELLDQDILIQYLFRVRRYSPDKVVSMLNEAAQDFQQFTDTRNKRKLTE